MIEREKYVDESWKQSAAEDKEKLDRLAKGPKGPAPATEPQREERPVTQPEEHVHGPNCNHDHGHDHSQHDHSHDAHDEADESPINFLNHIASLSYQAMIFLGEIPNPMTNEPEQNLEQAKYVIDTLAMLREKTQGNLSKKESDLLNTNLYQLQMRFVEASQKVA
jgi:ABC-type Zn2+ transport system substrate-binding protein/surface adhesin